MKTLTQRELALVCAGMSQDDMLDNAGLYGAVIGSIGGGLLGGFYANKLSLLLIPVGGCLGAVVGFYVGVFCGALIGLPFASYYGQAE